MLHGQDEYPCHQKIADADRNEITRVGNIQVAVIKANAHHTEREGNKQAEVIEYAKTKGVPLIFGGSAVTKKVEIEEPADEDADNEEEETDE